MTTNIYEYDPKAVLARFEHAVALMTSRHWQGGFEIDSGAISNALWYLTLQANGVPHDHRAHDDALRRTIDCMTKHGLCLEWILCGNVDPLIMDKVRTEQALPAKAQSPKARARLAA
jgi:hypothetical protein